MFALVRMIFNICLHLLELEWSIHVVVVTNENKRDLRLFNIQVLEP